MLGRWDAGKGLALQYQAPLKDFVLCQIAYVMHSRRETRISVAEFSRLVAHELQTRGYEADVNTLTEEMLHRSGLFRIMGDSVEFRHMMLQEFFAGRGLPSGALVETLIGDPWWRRALVFFFGDNAGQADLLRSLTEKVAMASPPTKYNAAITIGLALQASYLAQVTAKVPIAQWIIESLAGVFRDFEKACVQGSPFPLMSYLNYYLYARDSVAINILGDKKEEVIERMAATPISDEHELDLRQFWLIVGMIELGALAEARDMLRRFSPADSRLYLGVHLGCFLTLHLRVTTKEERDIAKKMCDMVAGHLIDLRGQLLNEFKSELLEVRKDKIRALGPGVPDDEMTG